MLGKVNQVSIPLRKGVSIDNAVQPSIIVYVKELARHGRGVQCLHPLPKRLIADFFSLENVPAVV